MVKKRNYAEVFDREPFVGTVEVPSFNRFKRRSYDSSTKKLITDTKPIGEHGKPNPEFLSEHGIDSTSMPHKWFKAFLLRSLTSQWNSFTSHKAILSNAGQAGKLYPDYTPFTNDEFTKDIGMYMVHGLDPSPQVSIKFTSQEQDEINGNDIVKRSLGPAATGRHKHFCRFFATQFPFKQAPTRSYKPNWKLELFLECIKSVSQKSWKLG